MTFRLIKGGGEPFANPTTGGGEATPQVESKLSRFADSMFDPDRSRCFAALVGMPVAVCLATVALASCAGAVTGTLERVPQPDTFTPSPAYQQLQR